MTDEEKAEGYVMNHECITRNCNQYPNCDSCNNQHMLQAYLEGFAEGRKEGYEQGKETLLEMNEVLDSIDAKTKIKSLEKENKIKEEIIIGEQKENAELSNSVTELTNTKTELENKVTELEKQIEKMKDCRNCKYYGNYKDDFMCVLVGQKIHCKNKNKWELAE